MFRVSPSRNEGEPRWTAWQSRPTNHLLGFDRRQRASPAALPLSPASTHQVTQLSFIPSPRKGRGARENVSCVPLTKWGRATLASHTPPSLSGVRPSAAGISRRNTALTCFNAPSYTIVLDTKPQGGAGSA